MATQSVRLKSFERCKQCKSETQFGNSLCEDCAYEAAGSPDYCGCCGLELVYEGVEVCDKSRKAEPQLMAYRGGER